MGEVLANHEVPPLYEGISGNSNVCDSLGDKLIEMSHPTQEVINILFHFFGSTNNDL